MILLDSGNTHNFLDSTVAKRAKLPICVEEKLRVRVANGDKLINEGMGNEIKVMIHGNYFTLDLFVLELVRCDMVLGVRWLQSLVIVPWNFNKLTVDFSVQGQLVTLQGLVSTQLLEESSCKKINKLEMRGVILLMVNQGDCTCE